MNSHSFFARHRTFFLFICAAMSLVSCGRKNKKWCNFYSAEIPRVSPVTLPYLTRLNACFDRDSGVCSLSWAPLLTFLSSKKILFTGYNVYRVTRHGFLQRKTCLQLPPGVHNCKIMLSSNSNLESKFAIAPVFTDELNREILGLVTLSVEEK